MKTYKEKAICFTQDDKIKIMFGTELTDELIQKFEQYIKFNEKKKYKGSLELSEVEYVKFVNKKRTDIMQKIISVKNIRKEILC